MNGGEEGDSSGLSDELLANSVHEDGKREQAHDTAGVPAERYDSL